MGAGIVKTAVVPLEGALLALAIIFTSARLFLRLVLHRSRLALSDWLLIASVADAVALFATDVMTYNSGGMDDYDPDAPEPPADQRIAAMKVSFAGNYFYDTGIYLPKLALLAFYYKLVPPVMRALRRYLYAVTGVTAVFMVATCFVDTFWCGPRVAVNWDPEGTCSSFTSMNVTRIDWSLNICADLLVFSIPFFLLPGLHLSRKYLIGLVVTFSLGIITLAASTVRFATMQVIHAWTNVYVLSMAEMVAAIIVVCLPSLKSLIRRGGTNVSKTGGTTSNSHGAGGYQHYAAGKSHIKLSSGRDYHASVSVTATPSRAPDAGRESGSDVELNEMMRENGIFKTQRLSVSSVREGRQ